MEIEGTIMTESCWKSVKEYLALFGLNILVKVRNLKEYVKVLYRYYRKGSFAKVDFSVLLMYLFDNPFSISRRYFLHRSNSEEYTYGETPLTTLDLIAKEARITAQDTVFEMGCGRARTCFWLRDFIGCHVVGVDIVPDFISRAKRIQRKLQIDKVEFRKENFLSTNLQGATVVYLYGSCLEDHTIEKLVSHFKKLAPGTRVITVSYSLEKYADEPTFEVIKRFPAQFTWGEADVYIQVKK